MGKGQSKDKGKKADGDSMSGAQFHAINEVDDDSKKEKLLVDETQLAGSGGARDALSYKSSQPHNNNKVFQKDELAEVKKMLLEHKNETMHEMIGTGAFAEVYRGVDHKTNKNVAIKVIDLKKASDHYREKLLPQEIAIMKQLKHDRIIKVYHISQMGYKVVMVMEYAAKGTMSELICKIGALGEAASWAMFSQVFSGVAYMHAKSIAHRDLKLDNILINHLNIPKLADFSFATYFDGATLCTNSCGSVPYFAPELLATKPYNPLVSDIWSAAICLYIITNDTFPFLYPNDDKAMMEAQLARNWRFRNNVKDFSPQYKELLRQMLEPDVDRRIRTAAVSKHAWLTTKLN